MSIILDNKDYTIEYEKPPLGKGAFGKTYKGTMLYKMQNKKDNVVIKKLENNGNSEDDFVKMIQTEIRNLKLFSDKCSENGLLCYKTCVIPKGYDKKIIFNNKNECMVNENIEDKSVFIITEFLAENTLTNIVENKKKQQKPFKLDEILSIMEQLLNSVKYIHDKGFVHHDIKPDNIIVTEENKTVLIDFGITCKSLNGCEESNGTPLFLAPESYELEDINIKEINDRYDNHTNKTYVQEIKEYRKKFDIYSLGNTFFYLLNGYVQFGEEENISRRLYLAGNMTTKTRNTPATPTTQQTSNYTGSTTENNKLINDFVNSMINLDPKIRPNITKLLVNYEKMKNSILKNIKFNNLNTTKQKVYKLSQTGGSDIEFYKQKYMKYKQKYLNLKL